MANEYKSFYLSDLVAIIERTALDIMGDPIVSGKKPDGAMMSPAEIANQNSLIAMHNSGIRELASTLVITLAKEGENDDG